MPDGKVLMRVIPEVSSVASALVNLGNGQSAAAINLQHFESTISAMDGETVVMGGMIQKQSQRTGKQGAVGRRPARPRLACSATRRRDRVKTELLVIMTPHVVRNRCDSERLLAEEGSRIDWPLEAVTAIHGTSGMGPVLDPHFFQYPVPLGVPLPPPQELRPMMPPPGPGTKPMLPPPSASCRRSGRPTISAIGRSP